MGSLAVCVFCGSREPTDPRHGPVVDALVATLASRGARLVYGGAAVGMMGRLADAALAAGIEVDGVMPAALFRREVVHTGITRLHEVDGMHARKALMADLADVFVALPGGLGTLEELFEVASWRQIGIHDKPVGLLDVHGFWGGLVSQLDEMVRGGFLPDDVRSFLVVDDDPARLLDRLVGPAGGGGRARN